MDYNNIKERIERLYLSIQIPVYDGVSEYLTIEKNSELNSAHFKTNQNNTANKVLMIVSNISNLKDHLKNILEKEGQNKQLVEDHINNYLPLQIIIDLNNAEKHGYPVTSKRSKLDPKICNLNALLKVHGDGNTSLTIDFANGLIEKNGNVQTIINADIATINNEFICTFDVLIENSIKLWELFISKELKNIAPDLFK